MRTSSPIRSIALVTIALASISSFVTTANAQAPKFVGRYATTTIGLNPGAAIATKIDILRWSTDEEADKLTEAFKKDSAKWAEALQAAPSVGYVWTASSSLGYSVKLARQVASPGGGSRIVLAIERPLGSWERTPWKAKVGATDYPFTVLELRVNAAGVGVGKGSLAGKVALDDALKAPAIENYATAPTLFSALKRTDAPAATKATAPAPTAAAPKAAAPKAAAPK